MDKTYLIFGDSVTQAAYVKVGWVDLLSRYLEGKYPNDFVNVFNRFVNICLKYILDAYWVF